jgi:lipopolysaccharide transport system ATP-binding protein
MNNVATQFIFSFIEGKYKIALHIDRLDLNVGEYYVDVGIYDSNWSYAYDFHCQVYSFFINSTINNVEGIISPPHRWELI